MKSYYRVMLGKKSSHADLCLKGGFIGADFGVAQDLTEKLGLDWKEFGRTVAPIYAANRPDKSRIAAGLACGSLWTIGKGMQAGDIVLAPDGDGSYRAGEVVGDYAYAAGEPLPHRRPVRWSDVIIPRQAMSEGLIGSASVPLTVVGPNAITAHAEEIERLIAAGPGAPASQPESVQPETDTSFALEKHLEEFLVSNWKSTELGQEYDIYDDGDGLVGQQLQTDTGPLDILAISKDKRKLLVVELKKGRAADAVVGQVLRYMGYVKEVLAESDQTVLGVIIAKDDDTRLHRALAMTPDVSFYRYQVGFRLQKAKRQIDS
jgi:restriction system protein